MGESQVRRPGTHRGSAPHVRTTLELQCTSSRYGLGGWSEGVGNLLDYPATLRQTQTHAHVALIDERFSNPRSANDT